MKAGPLLLDYKCRHQVTKRKVYGSELLENDDVVRPAYFSHHWCEFLTTAVIFVKQLHPPHVRGRESLDAWEVAAHVCGQLFDDGLAPCCPLLLLSDQLADALVEVYQLLVDGPQRPILGIADAALDLRDQGRVVGLL